MKRVSLVLLSGLLVLSLVGCGNKPIDSGYNLSSIEDSNMAVEPSSSEPVSTAPTNDPTETTETTETIETTETTKTKEILPQPIIINTSKLESNNLVFDLSWNGISDIDYDLDLIAFMLDSDDDCYDSNGFIFYNNAISFDNAIKLSADIQTGENGLSETMSIDLSLVSGDTDKIAVWVCCFYEDDYDMSELDAATLMIKNGDKDLNGCKITEGVSYEVCELLRKEDGWYIKEMNMASEYDLKDICISYGLKVD